MNVNNFFNFSILLSHFIGAFFAILKFNYAVDIILYFLMVSFCVNIILKFGISMTVKYTEIKKGNRFSSNYDDHLERIRININDLEKESYTKITKIHDLKISKMVKRRK
jgi:hypothetical protein